MKMAEHLQRLDGQDYSPRVIERPNVHGETIYYGWLPVWEGPPRPDWAAAHADLRDFLESTEYSHRLGKG